jgi:sterol desaturase/sphingolipid hydroxylase (fatty acid hydroxylase superfamily)
VPFHFSMIIFLAVLNVYLHCGYTFDFIEKTLPKVMIITSGFHNPHHSKGRVHFS